MRMSRSEVFFPLWGGDWVESGSEESEGCERSALLEVGQAGVAKQDWGP